MGYLVNLTHIKMDILTFLSGHINSKLFYRTFESDPGYSKLLKLWPMRHGFTRFRACEQNTSRWEMPAWKTRVFLHSFSQEITAQSFRGGPVVVRGIFIPDQGGSINLVLT